MYTPLAVETNTSTYTHTNKHEIYEKQKWDKISFSEILKIVNQVKWEYYFCKNLLKNLCFFFLFCSSIWSEKVISNHLKVRQGSGRLSLVEWIFVFFFIFVLFLKSAINSNNNNKVKNQNIHYDTTNSIEKRTHVLTIFLILT